MRACDALSIVSIACAAASSAEDAAAAASSGSTSSTIMNTRVAKMISSPDASAYSVLGVSCILGGPKRPAADLLITSVPFVDPKSVIVRHPRLGDFESLHIRRATCFPETVESFTATSLSPSLRPMTTELFDEDLIRMGPEFPSTYTRYADADASIRSGRSL